MSRRMQGRSRPRNHGGGVSRRTTPRGAGAPTTTTDRYWYKDAVIYEVHVRGVLRQRRRRHRRLPRADAQARLPAGPGRHRALAAAVLPLAPAGRRLRHRRLHRRPPRLRHARRTSEPSCGRPTRRGLRVITELVLNHTSDQHPWFQRARRAKPGSRWRDFYVWSDTPEKYREARIIFKDFETSNWTWDPVAERLLLAPLLLPPARPELRQPRGARGHAPGRRLLARDGRRRAAAGRRALPVRARGHELREPARDARLPQGAAARTSTSATPTACCWPRPTSGPRTPSPTSATATSATWRSTSR